MYECIVWLQYAPFAYSIRLAELIQWQFMFQHKTDTEKGVQFVSSQSPDGLCTCRESERIEFHYIEVVETDTETAGAVQSKVRIGY